MSKITEAREQIVKSTLCIELGWGFFFSQYSTVIHMNLRMCVRTLICKRDSEVL